MPDLYFYRNPEEVEVQNAEEVLAEAVAEGDEPKEEVTEEATGASEWAEENTDAVEW